MARDLQHVGTTNPSPPGPTPVAQGSVPQRMHSLTRKLSLLRLAGDSKWWRIVPATTSVWLRLVYGASCRLTGGSTGRKGRN